MCTYAHCAPVFIKLSNTSYLTLYNNVHLDNRHRLIEKSDFTNSKKSVKS